MGASSESGFTVIEMLIVLVIVATLGTIAFLAIGSSKDQSRRTVVKVTGAAYAQAIDEYAQDHGGLVPRFGSDDWTDPSRGPEIVTPKGRKRYVRSMPDTVANGRVEITAGAAGSTP